MHITTLKYNSSTHTQIASMVRNITRDFFLHSCHLQFLQLLSSEAVGMADALESCCARVTHITDYISDLRAMAKSYDKVSYVYMYVQYVRTYVRTCIFHPLLRGCIYLCIVIHCYCCSIVFVVVILL